MRNPIPFLLIGLFFGTGIGFIWAGSQGVTFDGHNHVEHSATGTTDHASMDHSPFDAPKGPAAPTLAITLHPDTMSGLNLQIQTTNFTFSPESVNQANTPNTGHAHVYVDGKKLSRIYGNWFHITGLASGEHLIKVELNANSHGVITVDGAPVAVEQTVTIP
ncbi:MAG: hypothetical protein KC451_04165 [Amylibacter sp.]|jgi:hypothetical protein|nr:hypothetical protein [Amylibacter sp.]